MLHSKHNQTSLDVFIQKTRKYGFFNQLKQFGSTLSKGSSSSPNKMDSQYRKKAVSYYAHKIKKPFRLLDQPEYQNQLKFNQNFSYYLDSLHKRGQNPEEKPIKPENLDKKVQRQAYQSSLTYKPENSSPISKQNMFKRKKKYATMVQNHLLANRPSELFEITKIKTQNQSQKEFGSFATSPNLRSPKKDISAVKIKPKFNVKSQRTNFSLSNIGSSTTDRKTIIDENNALLTLNSIQQTNFKQKNFRMSKVKLHEILSKKYGQDILVNFFGLQQHEDFNGIMSFVKQLNKSSDKLAQLITFLTFDYDQDGLVSENDLTCINNLISPDNTILQDINTLMSYVKQNKCYQCFPDLPTEFIAHPTYKQYLKMNKIYKTQQVDKMRGPFRLFSMKIDEQQEDGLPNIGSFKRSRKSSQKKSDKKYLCINFEHFQKAFEIKKRPNFINNLVQFLVGKQEFHKNDSFRSITTNSPKSPKPILVSKLKKKHHHINMNDLKSQTLNLQNNPQSISKIQEILHKLQDDKKYFATIKYD